MKIHHISILGLVLSFTALESAQATDISVNNASIAQSMFIGAIHPAGPESVSIMAGMRVMVTQSQAQTPVWSEIITPGGNEWQYLTIEDWGPVPDGGGYYAHNYSWQVVGQDYYPAITDGNGVEIQAAYSVDRYDNVWTDSTWVPSMNGWGVVGTHQEWQSVWVDGWSTPYLTEETTYGAARIEFQALRSDSNWVWQVPTQDGGLRDILSVFSGGLSINSQDPELLMALGSDSLIYSKNASTPDGQNLAVYNRTSAQEAKLESTTSGNVEGVWQVGTSRSTVKPHALLLEREEMTGSVSVSTQTQIAAKSASFGGVVDVAGNLTANAVSVFNGTVRVEGISGTDGTLTARKVRVPAGGDLPMAAEFQNDGGHGVLSP